MNPTMPADRILLRTVSHQVRRVQEHLEAMQRDAHGAEYDPWKREVDQIWKATFERINEMSPEPQRAALEMIREPWMLYLSHYAVPGSQ